MKQKKDLNSYKKGNSTQKPKHTYDPLGGGSGSLHDRERKKDNISTSNSPFRLKCIQPAVGK